ncbi:MAG TPA: TrbC family F-type conjugative pilus assembly protein [Burkholderiaceae bacterium]|jgi:conjugal transfer pilus assembly protein TrbC|nr:TrbC family F-type conjugative pilus assembly protein [Burkholderiaceae bacterium]
MRKTIAAALLSFFTVTAAHAEPMLDSIRADWKTYIFVSSTMPHESLVQLAYDSGQSGAVLVLNGFSGIALGAPVNIQVMQKFVGEINAACCKTSKRPGWIIDPKLFERYHVTSVPSFVIAFGDTNRINDYSLVVGDMTLANALKFFAQESKLYGVRERATSVYNKTYGSQ